MSTKDFTSWKAEPMSESHSVDPGAHNLALMKKGDDAFNRRDLAGIQAAHDPDMVAYIVGSAEPVRGHLAHAEAMQAMFRAFPDVHVGNDPYPVQFAAGDWTTVVTRAIGTFIGHLGLPDGTTIPGTGRAFDLLFTTTARWADGLLVEEYVFWDSTLMAQKIGLG